MIYKNISSRYEIGLTEAPTLHYDTRIVSQAEKVPIIREEASDRSLAVTVYSDLLATVLRGGQDVCYFTDFHPQRSQL